MSRAFLGHCPGCTLTMLAHCRRHLDQANARVGQVARQQARVAASCQARTAATEAEAAARLRRRAEPQRPRGRHSLSGSHFEPQSKTKPQL